jgi:signal transduction histidine kinase
VRHRAAVSFAAVAAVAGVGAIATLVAAYWTGMPRGDVLDLAVLLAPAALVTAAVAALARPLLERLPAMHALAAVGAATVALSLANLLVLTRLMFVSAHDARLVAVLLAYSLLAGAGASWALARSSSRTIERLAATAGHLRDGDLGARVGAIDGGAELITLGEAFDAMADRLEASTAHEREIESRRRDLFTAVSHDLRTPIANLQAMVEAIDDGVADDPETIGRYVREMRRAVEVLSALVGDLFQLAQLDAAALAADATGARLGETVHEAIDAVAAGASARSVEIVVDLGDSAPLPCSPRLARVIQNLLQNAVRHTPACGTVTVRARRVDAAVELIVEDTGEGFGAADA